MIYDVFNRRSMAQWKRLGALLKRAMVLGFNMLHGFWSEVVPMQDIHVGVLEMTKRWFT